MGSSLLAMVCKEFCPGSVENGKTPVFLSYIFRPWGGDFKASGSIARMRSRPCTWDGSVERLAHTLPPSSSRCERPEIRLSFYMPRAIQCSMEFTGGSDRRIRMRRRDLLRFLVASPSGWG